MLTTFVGKPGTVSTQPLKPPASGVVDQGTGGPGGTKIPGTSTKKQNCAGDSVGIDESINWPHIGKTSVGDSEWNKAGKFVPDGWKKVKCDGIKTSTTRCDCAGDVCETEIILFIYRWPDGKTKKGKQKYRSDFHMMGRDSSGLPSGWHSKMDKREKVEKINDPKKSLEDAYPRTKKSDHEIIRICFCASSTTTK